MIPVQELKDKKELANGFDWLCSQEDGIRKRLASVMPGYLERARQTGRMLSRLLEEK